MLVGWGMIIMGFEKFDKEWRFANFKDLNKYIHDETEIDKYYSNYMEKYSNLFKESKDIDVIEWQIRIRRALKELFTSASFYIESKKMLEEKYYSSYYYLTYYCYFHALLGNLYLLPEKKVDDLLNISHSKVVNSFNSNFCLGKYGIIKDDVMKNFRTLKFMREYYSYNMPLNEYLDEIKGITQPYLFLEDAIKPLFQLISLHSLMLEKCYSKFFKNIPKTMTKIEEQNFIVETFLKINAVRHPYENIELLDWSDQRALMEMRKYGYTIAFILIDMEHFMDDFRCMSKDRSDDEINIFVEKVLFDFERANK